MRREGFIQRVPGEQDYSGCGYCGYQKWHCGTVGCGEGTPQGRPEHETEAKSGENVAEALGALLAGRDVGNVGLGHDDIAAGDPIEDAGKEEPAEAGREGQDDKADDRPDLADDQDRNASVIVGKAADIGAGEELGGEERGAEQCDQLGRQMKLALGI